MTHMFQRVHQGGGTVSECVLFRVAIKIKWHFYSCSVLLLILDSLINWLHLHQLLLICNNWVVFVNEDVFCLYQSNCESVHCVM